MSNMLLYPSDDKLCCLDCDGFGIWDGDYCCTNKMQILSLGNPEGMALHPEKICENKCELFSQKYVTKILIQENYDLWNQNNYISEKCVLEHTSENI